MRTRLSFKKLQLSHAKEITPVRRTSKPQTLSLSKLLLYPSSSNSRAVLWPTTMLKAI